MQEVLPRLQRLLSDLLETNLVAPGMMLKADLGMESIDYLELIFYVQDEFDVSLEPEEAIGGDVRKPYNDITVAQLAEVICRKQLRCAS